MSGMRFSQEKARKLDKIGRMEYLSKYHKWLKEQREKDKVKTPYKHVSTGQHYLKNNLCPYCKKDLEVKIKKKLAYKTCKKHGLVQIRKWDGEK